MPHSLEWVECKRKIFLLDRAPRCLFFFSSHVRLLLEVGNLSIKCSKTLYFRKGAVKLISFRLKTYQVYCNRLLCFSKERSAYFCPKGGVLSSLYYLKSNYNGNWTDSSAIWSEIIHVISVRFEITSQCFQTKIAPHSVQLPLCYSHFEIAEFSQWSSIQFVQKWKQKGFYIQFCIQNRNDAI